MVVVLFSHYHCLDLKWPVPSDLQFICLGTPLTFMLPISLLFSDDKHATVGNIRAVDSWRINLYLICHHLGALLAGTMVALGFSYLRNEP